MNKTTKRNVVFITSIKGLVDTSYQEYCLNTWKYWCEKNNCELFVYDNPSESDLFGYRVTWQRWFDVFDILDKNNIKYNKVFVVDSSSMVRWDCPNFFEMTDDRMVAWRDMANMHWIYNSIQGYKSFFDNF